MAFKQIQAPTAKAPLRQRVWAGVARWAARHAGELLEQETVPERALGEITRQLKVGFPISFALRRMLESYEHAHSAALYTRANGSLQQGIRIERTAEGYTSSSFGPPLDKSTELEEVREQITAAIENAQVIIIQQGQRLVFNTNPGDERVLESSTVSTRKDWIIVPLDIETGGSYQVLGALVVEGRSLKVNGESSHRIRSVRFTAAVASIITHHMTSGRDDLTHLRTKKDFWEALELTEDTYLRTRRNYCVVLFDIDDFKGVNETYGHLAGDWALKKVAEIAAKQAGKIEIFRWGGEEFVLIMEGEKDEAVGLAERIRKAIAENDIIAQNGVEKKLRVTCSFGVASRNVILGEGAEGVTGQMVFGMADNAMLSAKRSGKNRVSAFGTHSWD
ncbi:MAG TPA: GGDEF domain-containing protein [Candidatus Bilamarchaeaceae archaeon]|nr:GGDEF domain-containing protein [Candidatus Bilamarchaeaceae archaeon]